MRGRGSARGELAGELAGEALGVAAVGGEDEDGAEAFAESAGEAFGPVALDAAGEAVDAVVDVDFFEGDGAVAGLHDGDVAAEAGEPRGDVGGVGDGAGEEEELHARVEVTEDAFVMVAAGGIGEPLVFVDGEEVAGGGGAGGGEKAGLDGLEGGDDDGGGGVDGEVAGDDADAPIAGAPLGEFVVGEGAGGDGEDGAAGEVVLFDEALEDVSFAGAGGSVEDDVATVIKGMDGLGLPAVGQDEGLENFQITPREHGGRVGGGRGASNEGDAREVGDEWDVEILTTNGHEFRGGIGAFLGVGGRGGEKGGDFSTTRET